jgi:septum site-determining protein MinC
VQSAAQQPAQPVAASGARNLPFQIRGSLQTMLSLRLLAPGAPDFFQLLLDKVAHSPEFFRSAPVVLDVSPVAGQPPIDLAAFVEQLRQHRLMPVGIQNGSPAWDEAALRAGLALFGAGGPAAAAASAGSGGRPGTALAKAEPVVTARRGPALTITETVRGGQQIVAADGDLVVAATVGHGAEVAAAGHVHVYGPLRGRAFAGIEGDEGAMIFCDQLEAQLLSIAGVHLVNEEIDPKLLGRRARVRLERERLVVQPVG